MTRDMMDRLTQLVLEGDLTVMDDAIVLLKRRGDLHPEASQIESIDQALSVLLSLHFETDLTAKVEWAADYWHAVDADMDLDDLVWTLANDRDCPGLYGDEHGLEDGDVRCWVADQVSPLAAIAWAIDSVPRIDWGQGDLQHAAQLAKDLLGEAVSDALVRASSRRRPLH